ncbi:MAG: hypothetical protein ACUVV0_11660 [Anaerolineae bacterium]
MSEQICKKCGSLLEEKTLREIIKGSEKDKTVPGAMPAFFHLPDFDTDLAEMSVVLVCTNPECRAIYPAYSKE